MLKFPLLLIIYGFICTCIAEEPKIDPNAPLPQGMVPCRLKDPKRDECFKNMIINVLPHLKQGYKPLGIGPIDPFLVKQIKFDFVQDDFEIRARPKNLTISGFSKLKIKAARTKITDDSIHFELDIFLGKLIIVTKYQARGKFADFIIRAKGNAKVVVSDVQATTVLKGVAEVRNGEKYMQLKVLDADPKIGGLHFNATGLLPDPNLNQLVLEFINQNWPYVIKGIVKDSKSIWDTVALDLFNGIISRIPFRRLFPDE